MSTYLRYMGGYKQSHLKGRSIDEIKELFNKETRKVNDFVAMDSEAQNRSAKEAQESSTKRTTKHLEYNIFKKQKVDENVKPVIDDTEELKKQVGMKTVPCPQYVLLPLLTSDFQGPKNSKDKVADDVRKKSTKVPRRRMEFRIQQKKVTKMIKRRILEIKKRPLENNLNKNLKDSLVKGRLLTLLPRWDYDPGKLWCCSGFTYMQTRSSPRLVSNPSSNPTRSTNPNLKGHNRRCSKQRIEDFNLEELSPPIVTMADQRTMAQLLQAPTEGYEDAIVVPTITVAWIWLEKEPPRSIFTWDDLVSKFINRFFPPFKTTNLRNEITNFQQRFDESFSKVWDRFKDLLRACPHHGLSELHQLDTFYNALNSKDKDSLNSAAVGNFLDKMPRECLTIIESKSEVRYSRNNPVVAKVSMNTSTSGISPDVAELKDMVKALLLDKKSQNQSPAPVKAVEESCVTCGGAHSYRNCPATDGNVYRNNIQELVSQASAVNYNQGNTSYRPPMMSKSNSTSWFSSRLACQPPVFQPPAYQALAPQTQGVSKEDLSAYAKANDAVMRNMQTQGQNMQNQLINLTDLITKFVNSNSASTSSSGTLLSNTIANPRSDLKAITTQSGVSYDGPQIPPSTSFPPKVVENEPEATNNTVNPTNNGSTEDVQPQVVQFKSPVLNSEPVTSPISEPVITPVSAPKPNPKSSIPYPSRRNDERNHKKANNQIEKFYQIFKDMSFKISFADALILIPKFASTLKALIGNKEKLSEMARFLLNEHCSAVLLKKLPKKLGDTCKFLIPCDFPSMAECLALPTLGASINLMPFSVWKRLSLPDLTPTCMTLELANRLISHPVGIAEDVYVKVGSFHFPTDFVVVDFDADPRVPLILGRSFLKTERDLIDVFECELTLRVSKEAITFSLDQTLRYSANYSDMTAKRIDIIDMACEEYYEEVLGFSDVIASGNPTSYYDPIVSITSLTLTPFRNSYFLLEEVDAFLAIEDNPMSPEFYQPYLDPKEDILLLEAFLNDDPSLPPPNQGNYMPEVCNELKIYEAKSDKSLVDEPPEVELKDLPPHLEYAFLEGDDKLPMIIAKDLSVEEKTALITVLKSHKRAIAWKLSDIKECVEAFQTLKRKLTEAPILIAPDWDMPFELMYDASNFAIGAVLGQHQDKHFRPMHYAIKTMTEAESNYTTTEKEMFAVVKLLKFLRLATIDPQEVTMAQITQPRRTVGENRESWSDKLDDALWAFRTAYKTPIGSGDHRKVQINELNELYDQAYEKFLIYKEKTKRLHDSKIKNRVFNIGDRVLLFNSRLKIFSGKLKSRWSGPFTISQAYPYGTVELSQPDGPNFKVNGHRLKHYFREDVPKLLVLDLQIFPRDH
uniref:Reverse transcriptase domain-containing protein n=1 Tax=Tanacetum cinerariifolium TaxID=118510 RepID=A0A6L2MDG8_TANCI|nr:reverse transcriptase domain-containing protein [Tanacetum cinerariifolium]